jgi:hypothetical protein
MDIPPAGKRASKVDCVGFLVVFEPLWLTCVPVGEFVPEAVCDPDFEIDRTLVEGAAGLDSSPFGCEETGRDPFLLVVGSKAK